MRIWDLHPGYLNRQSLLGEHRELHGMVSIIVNGKKGYSRHPETLRWADFGWALYKRHQLLKEKYKDKNPGRIPLPLNAQQMWRHHKYSIMARDVSLYKKTGADVALMAPGDDFSDLARLLTEKLRISPSQGGLRNALQHMWGYVSDKYDESRQDMNDWPLATLLGRIQDLGVRHQQPYLMESTALSELAVWIELPRH